MPLGWHVGRGINVAKIEHTQYKSMIAQNVESSITRLRQKGFIPCAQIFTMSPRSAVSLLNPTSTEELKLIATETPIVIHSGYYNVPWQNKPGSIAGLKRECNDASVIGAIGVVVHLAEHAKVGAKDVIPQFDDCSIFLEVNTMKEANAMYATPEKLGEMVRIAYEARGTARIGVCIDTAHLHACGVKLFTEDDASAYFGEYDDMIAPYERQGLVTMLHLNDSHTMLGSGIDKHNTLGEGSIWGPAVRKNKPIAETGLSTVLEWAQGRRCVTILERNDGRGIESDLTLLRSLDFTG